MRARASTRRSKGLRQLDPAGRDADTPELRSRIASRPSSPPSPIAAIASPSTPRSARPPETLTFCRRPWTGSASTRAGVAPVIDRRPGRSGLAGDADLTADAVPVPPATSDADARRAYGRRRADRRRRSYMAKGEQKVEVHPTRIRIWITFAGAGAATGRSSIRPGPEPSQERRQAREARTDRGPLSSGPGPGRSSGSAPRTSGVRSTSRRRPRPWPRLLPPAPRARPRTSRSRSRRCRSPRALDGRGDEEGPAPASVGELDDVLPPRVPTTGSPRTSRSPRGGSTAIVVHPARCSTSGMRSARSASGPATAWAGRSSAVTRSRARP